MIAAVVCTGTDPALALLGFALMALSGVAMVVVVVVTARRRARELARERSDDR